MGEYRHSGHAVCDIKHHLVWITKYRYKILRGEVAERARDLIRQICHAREVVIICGSVSPDHIHAVIMLPSELNRKSIGIRYPLPTRHVASHSSDNPSSY